MAGLIAILVLVVLVFGIASGMQSYASAKQAQATIEVAQVAQVNAWGNLVVILLLALVIVCVLALVVWMVVRRSVISHQPSVGSRPRQMQSHPQPALGTPYINMLVTLKMLEVLERMTPLSAGTQTSPKMEERNLGGDDEMQWLRRQ